MFKYFLTATFLGIAGAIFGTLIVWFAVSTWTNLSTHWINSGLVWPTLGLIGGVALSEGKIGDNRGKLRTLLTLVAIPLCGFSNFLAFVITSRTWFADKIPADQQSIFYQIAHPDVLPAFGTKAAAASTATPESWQMYLILGLVLGPVIFLWSTRKIK